MEIIIVTLLLGVGVGLLNILPQKMYPYIEKSMTIILFLMLMALGIEIGANKELLMSLPTLGFKALIIAAFSVLGSILFLAVAVKKLGLDIATNKENAS